MPPFRLLVAECADKPREELTNGLLPGGNGSQFGEIDSADGGRVGLHAVDDGRGEFVTGLEIVFNDNHADLGPGTDHLPGCAGKSLFGKFGQSRVNQ